MAPVLVRPGVVGQIAVNLRNDRCSLATTRRRISARMTISPRSAEPMISARKCAAFQGNRQTTFRSRLAGGERATACKLADLAGELSAAVNRDGVLAMSS